MWPFRRSLSTALTEQTIVAAVGRTVESALAQFDNAIVLSQDLVKTREALENLKIEKGRHEEEYQKREREIEHKVGLERKRQEFEVGAAKREALVAVREENLKADRARFEEQMKFQNDRFTTEVGYLKDMIGQLTERLPSAQMLVGQPLPTRSEITKIHKKG